MKIANKLTFLFLFIFIFNGIQACSKTQIFATPNPPEEENKIKDIVLPEDIQVIPYGGKASECQPGADIDKSYDGLFTTELSESHYHSSLQRTIHAFQPGTLSKAALSADKCARLQKF